MLEIRLLGPFEVELDGQSLKLKSRPARLLLAFLLLNHPGPQVSASAP